MKAIVVTDQAAGTAGVKLVQRPRAAGGDKRRAKSLLRRAVGGCER